MQYCRWEDTYRTIWFVVAIINGKFAVPSFIPGRQALSVRFIDYDQHTASLKLSRIRGLLCSLLFFDLTSDLTVTRFILLTMVLFSSSFWSSFMTAKLARRTIFTAILDQKPRNDMDRWGLLHLSSVLAGFFFFSVIQRSCLMMRAYILGSSFPWLSPISFLNHEANDHLFGLAPFESICNPSSFEFSSGISYR